MFNFSKYLGIFLLSLGVCSPLFSQLVTEVARPRLAVAADGSFAIAQEILSGTWKVAVQLYSPSGDPIGSTNVFEGESCSSLDIWTSDFMDQAEIAFRSDGILVVTMQHSGDLSFGGDQLISSEITIAAIDKNGAVIDLNDGPCQQFKVVFVNGGRQDRPRMTLTSAGELFLIADGFFGGSSLRNVGIRIYDAALGELLDRLTPHNDELSQEAFHIFPDVATNSSLVATTWQRCPIIDQAGNAAECDVEAQFIQISNNQLQAVGGNQVVNAGDPFGTVNIWPSAAMNESGRAIIAWADTRNGGAGDIFVQLFNGGQKVGGNIQVSAGQGEIYRRPEVAINTDGGFMVVWEDSSSAGFTARGREFNADGTARTDPFELSPRTGSQNGAPHVTSNGNRFFYTWVESSGGPLEVFTNAFTTTATGDGELPSGSGIQLAAYPSPFSDALTVSFELGEPESVAIDLYDLLGRHVGRLREGMMAAGRNRAQFSMASLPVGMYLIKVTAGDDEYLDSVFKSN